MFILFFLFLVTVSSKVYIKTFEQNSGFFKPVQIASLEARMNAWLNQYPDIVVINTGVYRSDDKYDSYVGGHIAYHCESLN